MPLVRDNGPAVLVDRGFVPFDHGSTLASYPSIDGPTIVEGIARVPEMGGWFTPGNRPDQNIWYTVDIAALTREAGMPLAPIYIATRPSGARRDGPPGPAARRRWASATSI